MPQVVSVAVISPKDMKVPRSYSKALTLDVKKDILSAVLKRSHGAVLVGRIEDIYSEVKRNFD